VALVMAAMMLAMALPVLADRDPQPPGPPSMTGDFDNANGSLVSHSDQGACVEHFGGGNSTDNSTGGGC
jgi:hypothetical protein